MLIGKKIAVGLTIAAISSSVIAGTAQTYGNITYYSDGTSLQRYGNQSYYSDGTTESPLIC